VLKFDKKDEATAKIKQRAQLKNSLAGMISDFSFQDASFRLYSSGKIIFKGVKNKQELNNLLAALLL
jgi:TATA-box binding protein (TBP) (component of TFIID and TFIIIB)